MEASSAAHPRAAPAVAGVFFSFLFFHLRSPRIKIARVHFFLFCWVSFCLCLLFVCLLFSPASFLASRPCLPLIVPLPPQEYIAFKTAQFSSFSIGSLRETYARAFRSILALKRRLELDTESQVVFETNPEQLESQMMDLFLRYCHLERSAGCTERAVALLQVVPVSLFSISLPIFHFILLFHFLSVFLHSFSLFLSLSHS